VFVLRAVVILVGFLGSVCSVFSLLLQIVPGAEVSKFDFRTYAAS